MHPSSLLEQVQSFDRRVVRPVFEALASSSAFLAGGRRVRHWPGPGTADLHLNQLLAAMHPGRAWVLQHDQLEVGPEYVGRTLLVEEPDAGVVHPDDGRFFASVIYQATGDQLTVAPFAMYYMRCDQTLHRFAHRFTHDSHQSRPRVPLTELTSRDLETYLLDALTFFEKHARDAQSPF